MAEPCGAAYMMTYNLVIIPLWYTLLHIYIYVYFFFIPRDKYSDVIAVLDSVASVFYLSARDT